MNLIKSKEVTESWERTLTLEEARRAFDSDQAMRHDYGAAVPYLEEAIIAIERAGEISGVDMTTTRNMLVLQLQSARALALVAENAN